MISSSSSSSNQQIFLGCSPGRRQVYLIALHSLFLEQQGPMRVATDEGQWRPELQRRTPAPAPQLPGACVCCAFILKQAVLGACLQLQGALGEEHQGQDVVEGAGRWRQAAAEGARPDKRRASARCASSCLLRQLSEASRGQVPWVPDSVPRRAPWSLASVSEWQFALGACACALRWPETRRSTILAPSAQPAP